MFITFLCTSYEPEVQSAMLFEAIWWVGQISSNKHLIVDIFVQQHPKEYIRGATLQFLQKIAKDAELLEPLIPTCRSCLKHRHSYVRKNAMFAVYSIYRELSTSRHS